MLLHSRVRELLYGIEGPVLLKALLGILVRSTFILQAIVLGRIIQGLYQRADLTFFLPLGIMIAFLLLLRLLLIWLGNVLAKAMMARVKNVLRRRAYEKLLALGPGVLARERTGELEATIVSGIDYLEGYLTLYIPQVITVFVVSSALIIYLFTLSVWLGSLALLCAIFALASPRLFGKVLSQATQAHWENYEVLNADLVDAMQGMETLKAYGQEQRMGRRLKEKIHHLYATTMKNLRINLREVGIANFLTLFGSTFTLALAALFAYQGKIPLSTLSVLIFLTREIFVPIEELAVYFHQGFMGMTSADGLFALFDQALLIEDHSKAPFPKDFKHIRVKDLSFTYPGSEQAVFTDLSMDFIQGKRIALVGTSGSGKTTLFQLFMRYFDPDKGGIYVDDQDLRNFSLASLRQAIAYVSQDTYLFHGTVRENLYMAMAVEDEAAMMDACKQAQIHDVIMGLPQGYDTLVGEGGKLFSGGQRQRISIARALLKQAPILLLDEATSAVDKRTQDLIKQSLHQTNSVRTTIEIAHRLSIIEDADYLFVFSKGKLMEAGTHQALMAKRGLYYRLRIEDKEAEAREKEAVRYEKI